MSPERLGQYCVSRNYWEALQVGGESPGEDWEVGLTLPPCLHSGLSKAVNISSAPPVSGLHAPCCVSLGQVLHLSGPWFP